MKVNYNYYNHRYYNYDYDDMKEFTFSINQHTPTHLTSKVYPTKLDVKIDEETNLPYLYYEGVVQTNKGPMKVTFPQLDLVLDCMQVEKVYEKDFMDVPGVYLLQTPRCKMITKFNNIYDDSIMFELKMFEEEDYKDMKNILMGSGMND